jgi:phosphoglycolate phosphatase
MKSARPRAVVFDLDGTLVDSVADVTAALAPVMRGAGLDPLSEAEVRNLMGHGAPGLLRGALDLRGGDPALAATMTRQFLDRYAEAPAVRTTAYPGAVAAVAALAAAGIAVGICTNKAAAMARAVLEALGFAPHIAMLVGGDSGHGMKPDPAPLLTCIAGLGATPGDTAYIGDHAVDVATARAAGVRVLVVPFGYGDVSTLAADGLVPDFAGLPALLGVAPKAAAAG